MVIYVKAHYSNKRLALAVKNAHFRADSSDPFESDAYELLEALSSKITISALNDYVAKRYGCTKLVLSL